MDFIVILQQISKAEYERAQGIESAPQSSQTSQASYAPQSSYAAPVSSSIPTTTTRGTERMETPFMISRMEPENPSLSPASRAAINEAIQSSYGTADVSRPRAEYLPRTTSLRGEPYYPGGSPMSPRQIPPRSATDTGLREQVKAPMEAPSRPTQDRTVDDAARDVQHRAKATGQQFARDLRAGTVPIPEDKRQDILRKVRTILEKTSVNPSYRRSVEGLMFLMDEAMSASRQAQSEGGGFQSLYKESPHFGLMMEDAKIIVAEFVGRQPLDNFLHDSRVLSNNFYNDSRARSFFRELQLLIRDALDDPTFLESQDYRQRSDSILATGRQTITDPRHRDQFQSVINEGRVMLENFREDPTTKRLRSSLGVLVKDLVLDEQGKPSLMVTRDGIARITRIVVPLVRSHLERIPIPRIENSSPKYDFAVDNLVLFGRDIVPEHINVYLDNDAMLDTFKGGAFSLSSELTLHV